MHTPGFLSESTKVGKLLGAGFSIARKGEEMTKRGKVLRDPLAGSGLLIAEGRQYQFALDGAWKSNIPPKPGLAVEIDFDGQGRIAGIVALPDSRTYEEQERVTVGAKKGPGLALFMASFAQCELPNFIAASLLLLSWFSFTAVSVELPFSGTVKFTFFQLFRSLGSGAYGVVALASLSGVVVHRLWKNRQGAIGGLLPLSFMALSGVLLFSKINDLFANGGNHLYQQISKHGREDMMSSVSFGPGTYVSLLISIYFAVLSVKQFRRDKHNAKDVGRQSQKAAA